LLPAPNDSGTLAHMDEACNTRTEGEQAFASWLDSLPDWQVLEAPLKDLDAREALKRKKIEAAKRKHRRANGGTIQGLKQIRGDIFPNT